jgi:NhaP-type Na+/H+ or K+/H+ antiporter
MSRGMAIKALILTFALGVVVGSMLWSSLMLIPIVRCLGVAVAIVHHEGITDRAEKDARMLEICPP